MTWMRFVRSELRKLTTTKMPLAFVAVIVVLAGVTAAAVVWGTDMDGSKTFISTGADQLSLMAFAGNAFMGAALFGAVATAREFGHATVVPTFLTSPRRSRAMTAQAAAVMVVGAALSILGALAVLAAVFIGLQFTDYAFLADAGGVVRVVAASAVTGAAGAALGAGVGWLVRNSGGAVTVVVGLLFICPPLLVQLTPDAASWMPTALAWVVSGVSTDQAVPTALLAVLVWAAIPVLVGLVSIERRDVV
jgi:ABC-2 type transport system permease protein